MLIVTRREGERVCLGESLEIEVRAIEADTVTLAILSDRCESVIRRLSEHKTGRFFQAANESVI